MPDPGEPVAHPSSRGRYRFGDYELDADRLRLRGPGGPVRAEPRALEVLAYLLEHGDRVVTKDELIEAVWGGRAMSDGAVGRAVYLARRAVGDAAAGQRVISTVHGRGYRISRQVEIEKLEPTTRGEVQSPRAPRATKAVVAGLLVLAALVAFLVPRREAFVASRPPPPAERAVRIAVVPSSAATRLAGMAICDAVARRLERAPGVLMRDCAAAGRAAERASALSELGEGLGADLVVSGGYREGLVSADLLDLRGPRPDRRGLDPVALETPVGAQLDRAADELAGRVLAAAALSGTLSGRAIAAPEDAVLRLYLRARSERGVSCVGGGVLDLYAAVTERAPRFAPAWRGLATEHLDRASFCGGSRRHYESAGRALKRARAEGDQSSLVAALTAEALLAEGLLREAYETVERAEREGPDARLDWIGARVLLLAGEIEAAAVRARRALAADPDHDLHGRVAGLLAAELPPRVTVRARSDPPGLVASGLAALRADDREVAAAILRPAFRADPAHLYARLAEGYLAWTEGSPEDAARIAREIERDRAARGGGDAVVDYRLAQLLAVAGDLEGSAAALERAWRAGLVWPPLAERDPLFTDTPLVRRLPETSRARSERPLAAAARRLAAAAGSP